MNHHREIFVLRGREITVLGNNVKAFIIHLVISIGAYFYTEMHLSVESPISTFDGNAPQPEVLCLVVFAGSIALYIFWSSYFLNRQPNMRSNIWSVMLTPAAGLVMWAVIMVRCGFPHVIDFEQWMPYMLYTGYLTPLFRARLQSTWLLPAFSLFPALFTYIGLNMKKGN